MSREDSDFKGPRWTEQVTPELLEAVKAKAFDGRITCAALRRVAEQGDVTYPVAGTAADMQGIKIKNCDLGCF